MQSKAQTSKLQIVWLPMSEDRSPSELRAPATAVAAPGLRARSGEIQGMSRARDEGEPTTRPWAMRSRARRRETDSSTLPPPPPSGPIDVSHTPEHLLVAAAVATSEKPASDLEEANERLALLGGQLERLRTFLRLTDEGIWCFEFD